MNWNDEGLKAAFGFMPNIDPLSRKSLFVKMENKYYKSNNRPTEIWFQIYSVYTYSTLCVSKPDLAFYMSHRAAVFTSIHIWFNITNNNDNIEKTRIKKCPIASSIHISIY